MKLLLFFFTSFILFHDTFAQTEFSISVKDTLTYQFQSENNTYKLNVGSVNYDQKPIEYNFYLTNNSDNPLFISRAFWGEPSIGPSFNNDTIVKGQSGLFKYTLYETKRVGRIPKTVNVETNQGFFSINFFGNILPPEIFIDNAKKIDTITLGDTLITEFKVYNKSDIDSLTIENIQIEMNTIVIHNKDEIKNYENLILPNTYRTFKVLYIPYKNGVNSSKITISLSNSNDENQSQWSWRTVEHNIFATVKEPKEN
jgi:hypothetical protein